MSFLSRSFLPGLPLLRGDRLPSNRRAPRVPSEDGDTAFGIYYRYNQGWETHLYTGTHNIGNGLVSGSIVFDDYTRFTSAVDFENAVDINTASISTLTMLGNGNLSIGGRLRLLYESNPPLWGPLSRRPSTNLVAGQLYFQTD